MAKNEVKWGAILSYLLIFINSVYGLIIAPFILGTIGESEYGVYKSIASIATSISVLELGLGGTVQRFLAKYNAQKDKESAYNFSAMAMIQALILSLTMVVICVFLYLGIDNVYSNSFTPLELVRAKQIFALMTVYIALHIFENVFLGIISGYNRFVFSNSMKLTMLALKIILYLVILPIIRNSLVIVGISLFLEISTIIIEYIFIKSVLKHKIKLIKWDNSMFRESFAYTMTLFVQSIVIQFNGNLDNIVIGAVIGTSAVTVYSFGITIYNMYQQCATAISGVVLPTVTNQIYGNSSEEELEATVVKFGRVQWMTLGCVLFAFICFGKELFYLWLGEGFEDCYLLALLLMVPVTFHLILNVYLAVLRAKNLMFFRTLSLAYSTVINAIITIAGIKYFGYWAAAVGTSISIIVGSVISLNIYYHIKLKVNVTKIYLQIMKGTTFCLLIAFASGIFMNRVFVDYSWLTFIVKGMVFMAVYGLTLFIFVLKDKKNLIDKFRK